MEPCQAGHSFLASCPVEQVEPGPAAVGSAEPALDSDWACFSYHWHRVRFMSLGRGWQYYAELEIGWLGLALIRLTFGLITVSTLLHLRWRWPEPERGAWTVLALEALTLWSPALVGVLFSYTPIIWYFRNMIALLDMGLSIHRENKWVALYPSHALASGNWGQ